MNTYLNFVKSRKILVVVGVIVAVFVVVGYGYPAYKGWSGRKGVENLAKALEQAEKEDYKLALADTYGGKTPQETLGMFIKAVEDGDYELASKYFIIPKQEEWRNNLKDSKNIEEFLSDTRKIKENINNGRYSDEKDWFLLEAPIYTKLLKYPAGNWKIMEI